MPINKNFFLAERRSRLRWMLKLLKDNKKTRWKKLKGIMILKTGLKGKTIDQYLTDLIEGGVIEWNEENQNYTVIL